MGTPAADIAIDDALIAALVADQAPELAGQPVRIVANGWDNTIARLGDEWMVRLPRRQVAVELIVNELRWLPELAPRLPLPVPVAEVAGAPTEEFPYPFVIGRWLPGVAVSSVELADPAGTVTQLAAFVRALHVPAPADAPANPFRGVALQQRADAVGERVERLGSAIDGRRALAVWEDLCATEPWAGPPLAARRPAPVEHARGGRPGGAMIDFGDICAGDPATDLAMAWMMFDATGCARFRDEAAIDPATWRAAGWALNLALAYLTADDTTLTCRPSAAPP
ncbi:MAG: phosphotransferase [Ilumatobacteraceae bacterium]